MWRTNRMGCTQKPVPLVQIHCASGPAKKRGHAEGRFPAFMSVFVAQPYPALPTLGQALCLFANLRAQHPLHRPTDDLGDAFR